MVPQLEKSMQSSESSFEVSSCYNLAMGLSARLNLTSLGKNIKENSRIRFLFKLRVVREGRVELVRVARVLI
jgi:hypothetical protein